MPTVGYVIKVEDNRLLLMQGPNAIEYIHFGAEMKDIFMRTKRRIVVISNVVFNGQFEVKKLGEVKVLKLQKGDWLRFGPNDPLNICPRLSHPQQYHDRWPYRSDSDGRNLVTRVHACVENFNERILFNQRNNWSGVGFTKMERIILADKMELRAIEIKPIPVPPVKFSTPTKKVKPVIQSQKSKYKVAKSQKQQRKIKPRRLEMGSHMTDIIDLCVTSDEDEVDEQPTAEDLLFIDDDDQIDNQMSAQKEFTKEQKKAFHTELLELIGDLLCGETYTFRSKIISARAFYHCLSTANPVNRLDLQSLIKGLPTQTVQMEPESIERLCDALDKAEFTYCFE